MDLKDKIVICSGKIRPVAIAYLQDKVTLKSWQQRGRVPEEQWKEWLQEADALYSTGNIRIDETLLQKAPKLQVAAQSSVGYDKTPCIRPGTSGLMKSCCRKLRSCRWRPSRR